MLKKMLYILNVTLLLVFSNAQAVELDAETVAAIKRDAEQGDASAQGLLGVMYDQGKGVRQDYAEARKWYEKAAIQGHDDAQLNLGVMYHDGKGVRQDYVKAREWYEKAAAQGNAKAQLNLGGMYVKGQGVSQNELTAREWFSKACDNGLQQGCDNYHKLKEDAKTQAAKYDADAALVAMIKADAERGDAIAQCALAECYVIVNCEGIPHDYVSARQWFEKAAAQGNAEAQSNLGVMYYEGHGVRQDKRTAKEWFGKACDNGNQKGCDWYRKLNKAGF